MVEVDPDAGDDGAQQALVPRVVRIAGASACENDSSVAIPQLLRDGGASDYLTFDELSELNIAALAGGVAKGTGIALDPTRGYVQSFIDAQVGPHLAEIVERRIRLVANAGGTNPRGCAEALAARAAELGLDVKVAFIEGDNLLARVDDVLAHDPLDMASGQSIADQIEQADRVLTLLAYTGALPFAQALAAGADIVIGGRCADSAPVLGALMHEFGWSIDDFDRLAAGSLCGHLIECSAQVCGGIFTDWAAVPDWSLPSYPIAEISEDGSFVLSVCPNTGGMVTVGTVAEQLLYETADPQRYLLPDVVCDFSAVQLTQVAPNRVRVSGARGHSRTSTYKTQLSFEQGWRASALYPIVGFDAAAKAERMADAMFEHTRRLLADNGLAPPDASEAQYLGVGDALGAHADPVLRRQAREVVLRMTIDHRQRAGAQLFLREQAVANIAMSVGVAMPLSHSIHPIVRVRSFLVDKALVELAVTIGDERTPVQVPVLGDHTPEAVARPEIPAIVAGIVCDAEVPLLRLAWGRSGDKGNTALVGIIARDREYLPYLAASLSEATVADWLRHQFEPGGVAKVDRYYSPGVSALNFVLHDALGGGQVESRRIDPMGKSIAQQLLAFPVPVPRHVADAVDADWERSA